MYAYDASLKQFTNIHTYKYMPVWDMKKITKGAILPDYVAKIFAAAEGDNGGAGIDWPVERGHLRSCVGHVVRGAGQLRAENGRPDQ